jgi:hypothetical protein
VRAQSRSPLVEPTARRCHGMGRLGAGRLVVWVPGGGRAFDLASQHGDRIGQAHL